MTGEPAPAYPRRSLIGALLDLLTGAKPTPVEPAAPLRPSTEDFSDDPTGAWAPPGPAPWTTSPADPATEDRRPTA
ncbi:hypothetical protein ACIHEI_34090 [Kitasatospora sp. NPDC051984]|uniref:hypothetical protein n=1 Tax=Kitasatospora sp. NPDC051984 TaxID=3364059 RepID=UPI0037CBE6EE